MYGTYLWFFRLSDSVLYKSFITTLVLQYLKSFQVTELIQMIIGGLNICVMTLNKILYIIKVNSDDQACKHRNKNKSLPFSNWKSKRRSTYPKNRKIQNDSRCQSKFYHHRHRNNPIRYDLSQQEWNFHRRKPLHRQKLHSKAQSFEIARIAFGKLILT